MRSMICLLTALSVATYVRASSTGAPITACSTMTPVHTAEPQGTDMPYSVSVSSNEVAPGGTIDITVDADEGVTFRGVLVQVREGTTPVGTFTITDVDNTRTMDCNGTANSVTHSNPSDKTAVSVQWTAPEDITGDLVVTVTVVQTRPVFWAAVPTEIVTVA